MENQSNQTNQNNQNLINNTQNLINNTQNSTGSNENSTDEGKGAQPSTDSGENGTMGTQANTGAAGSTAEDTLDGYKALIEQMKSQNEALLNQNKSLQSQLETLIRNGASVTQPQQPQGNGPDDGGEHYTSLADLGAEIGKRDYKPHNMKE